ncbi:MAG: hypothetical protein IJW02_00160, partial [Clostridia bacterium]|nr:hypothetical protein [Clostridia bacterium]
KSIGETGNYYKNVVITDGTTDLLIYTINMGDGITGFEVGDVIIANGYIKNYKGTIEMATNNGVYVNAVAVNPGTTGGNTPGGDTEETPKDDTSLDVGSKDAPLTTTEAVNACKDFENKEFSAGRFYVTGVVTKIGSVGSYYSQVYITDGTTELLVYTISLGEGISGFTKGDTIVAYGYMQNYNDTLELTSKKHDDGSYTYVYAISVVDSCANGHDYADATCTAPKTCKVCDATEGSTIDHNYVDGACSVCGAKAPVAGQTTVNVVIADYADAKGWANSVLYDTVVIDNVVSVKATGTPYTNSNGQTYDLNTGKYYTSGENWRIYQNENPQVTITAEGKTIVSVKITYAVKNTGCLTLDGETITSGTVVDVNASSITFSVGNTGEATNGQAQITAIEVIYQ